MRTHGWSGAKPASDEEAMRRILAAASKAIEDHGADFSISDVARSVGVTRQTVYRYFPSTEALLVAAAVRAVDEFLHRLAVHVAGITDPADAVTEAVATALEWLPDEKYIGLLLVPGGTTHAESVTSDVALQFGRDMIGRLDVDWAASGYGTDDGTDRDLDELAEHLLRVIQSFVIDPGRPPRRGADLRAYLRRWVGGALSATPPSAAATASAGTRKKLPR
ncbi:MAG: helix-turn-helix domain containing protein [Mycobacterium kyogaense]|uniref:TetR/AcrR family transcriptional regulator n=1 Tax=Mycobacterium kyogaense TaxID=2212479 RepID=UPI002FF8A234